VDKPAAVKEEDFTGNFDFDVDGVLVDVRGSTGNRH